MDKSDFDSVDRYLAAQPAPARAILQLARAAIRRAVPDATETISYQIPTYRLAASAVLYLAGWKQHYSIYPVTAAVLALLADDPAPHQVAKGTVRFPLDAPVPDALIERIARPRAGETLARAATKLSRPGAKAATAASAKATTSARGMTTSPARAQVTKAARPKATSSANAKITTPARAKATKPVKANAAASAKARTRSAARAQTASAVRAKTRSATGA